jgi:glycosyltransferase involved in cell wall biosynthesis
MTDLIESSNVVSEKISYTEISDPAVLSNIPLVSVLIITYNHDPYIADAIEGVISQKIGFPIELIIGEDCSTDNTRSIVLDYQRLYPKLIRVIYSDRNVGMQKNFQRVHEAARANYIAICEGDDVWTDDRKLDKQIGIMESEPDCSIVFHAAEIFREREGTVNIKHYGSSVKTFSLDEVILAHPSLITTASLMMRRTLIEPIPRWVTDCEVGDYPFTVHCASRGKVIYLPDVMCRYRHGVPGSWSVRSGGIEPRKKIVDSILWMLNEFLRETGNEASEAVRKRQRKFIMMYLYFSKNEHPSLLEQDRLRYMSYLTWKDKGLIFLTKFYVPRRMVKLAFEVREYVRRRLSGRKVSTKVRLSGLHP